MGIPGARSGRHSCASIDGEGISEARLPSRESRSRSDRHDRARSGRPAPVDRTVFRGRAARMGIAAHPRHAAFLTGDERGFHCRRSTGQVADRAPLTLCGPRIQSFRRHHVAAQLRPVWKRLVPSPVVPGCIWILGRAKRRPARPDAAGHGRGRDRGGTSPFQNHRLVSDPGRDLYGAHDSGTVPSFNAWTPLPASC